MRHFLVISLLFLVSCVTLKEVGVFDEPANQKEPDGFNGFYSTSIYSDFITQEVWFTRSETCLKVEASEEVKYSGEAALHLQWDKISQSCEWLGLGIGWDSWNGKDIKNIINNGAIEMMVRNKEGVRKGLPLAACLEDYSDGQAWIGFSANAILAKEIGEEWVKVRLPFSEFEWDAVNGANPSNIKQFIIQFEADGDIYVDDIKVVEFNGSFRKRINPLLVSDLEISIDGSIESAWGKAAIHMDSNPVFIASDNTNLYLAAALSDDTPGENANTGKDIWNGDALEIAFSTDPQSNKKRSYYKTTDQHIGIRLTDKPVIWDWQNESLSHEVHRNNPVLYLPGTRGSSC